MDGMIFVAFFFPLILCLSIVVSLLGFLFSLWVGFGEQISGILEEGLGETLPSSLVDVLVSILKHPPLKRWGPMFYPAFLNVVLVSTVMGTYSLGQVLYHKRGWKFAQPMRGGLRFVLLQGALWTVFSIALTLPWLSVRTIGLLNYFDMVGSSEKDSSSFGGLLVSSAALGMVSQSLVIVALMVFDSNNQSLTRLSRRDLRSLEHGNWNWNKMFGESSDKFWWLFIALQSSMALFAFPVAWLSAEIEKSVVKGLMMMVFVAVLSVAIALTNAVGGKWRHGEFSYHIFMPFRGGFLFALFQGLGWMLFAAAILTAILNLLQLTFEAPGFFSKITLGTAGLLGVVSQSLIAASLFLFDPQQAGKSPYVKKIEQLGKGSVTRQTRHVGNNPDLSDSRHKDDSTSTSKQQQHLQSRGGRTMSRSMTGPRRVRSKTPVRQHRQDEQEQAVFDEDEDDMLFESDDGMDEDERRENLSSTSSTSLASASKDAQKRGRRVSQVKKSKKQAWNIDRIIGKRARADIQGGFEFLVQWKSPKRISTWVMTHFLVSNVDKHQVSAAIEAYERESAEIGRVTDDEDEEHGEKDRRDPQSVKKTGVDKRKASKSLAPIDTSYRDDESAEHEWEECEDEMGNVFYYCVTTGETAQSLQPEQLSRATFRQTPTSTSSSK